MSKETPQETPEPQESPENFYAGLGVEVERPYTPEEVAKLFVGSFRFSQGEPGIQQLLFDYLCQEYGDKLSPELLTEGTQTAAPRIEKLVTSGISHDVRGKDKVRETIADERNNWLTTLDNHSQGKGTEFDPQGALKQILARETRFLGRKKGRPRPEGALTGQSGPRDRFTSQLVYYGLMGKDTDMPEFNRLFAMLLAELPNIPEEGVAQNRYGHKDSYSLYRVLERHFDAHPEDRSEIGQDLLTLMAQVLRRDDLEALGLSSVQ